MHPADSKASSFFRRPLTHLLIPCWLLLLLAFPGQHSSGQDRLKTMPGYERYQKMSRETTNAAKLGTLSVTWKDGGKAFELQRDGKRFRYDIASLKANELTN